MPEIQSLKIYNVKPTVETISTRKYKLVSYLYLYLNNKHVAENPAIKDYAKLFISDKALGANGFLVDEGLTPKTEAEQKGSREQLDKLFPFSL